MGAQLLLLIQLQRHAFEILVQRFPRIYIRLVYHQLVLHAYAVRRVHRRVYRFLLPYAVDCQKARQTKLNPIKRPYLRAFFIRSSIKRQKISQNFTSVQ